MRFEEGCKTRNCTLIRGNMNVSGSKTLSAKRPVIGSKKNSKITSRKGK